MADETPDPNEKQIRPIALFPDDTTPPEFANCSGAVSMGATILVQFGYYDPNEVLNRLQSGNLSLLPVEGYPVNVRSLARFALSHEQAELLVQQLLIAMSQAGTQAQRIIERKNS